jgi:sugar lactone lactonase YvrE
MTPKSQPIEALRSAQRRLHTPQAAFSWARLRVCTALLAAAGLAAACGGGGGSGGGTPGGGGTATTYSVGGAVSGLVGTGLTLEDNGSDSLAVAASGTFAFATPIASGAAFSVTVKTQPSNPFQTCVVNGGSGSVANGDVTSVTITCATGTYTLGGTVAGLTGSGLVLQNGAGDDLSVTANGSFVFSAPIASGSTYSVTVMTQPANPAETCVVSQGTGTIANANVTGVSVVCTTTGKGSATVGGTVSGLTGTGLVLQDNGADNLPVSANGSFAFATALAAGAPYSVSVKTQPSNPAEVCTVANGFGTVGSANISSVAVTCATVTYPVGGSVSGLAGSGLVLLDNGGDPLAVTTSGAFTFPTALANGSAYAVTVRTQPTNPTQVCAVTNGSGVIGSGPVSTVVVSCAAKTYTVGGSVSGLAGSGLILTNNGGDALPVSANGSFTFATTLNGGAGYLVAVKTQPTNPAQTCTVANGTGSIATANVTNVTVTCPAAAYTVGGNVTGLTGAGLVLADNGADPLTVSANGSFAFATPVASGTAYAVTVMSQPAGQMCSVTSGGGTVGTANVTDVTVTCVADVAATLSLLAGNMGGAGNLNGIGALASFGWQSVEASSSGDLTNSMLSAGSGPWCIATDTAGNVYLCDSDNNLIRKMSSNGAVTTLAGSGANGDADGPAAQASFNGPDYIAVDGAGNLYVAESGGNRIRKITPAGLVSTFAGSGAQGAADGPAATATFATPTGLAIDSAGNVYVADEFNNTIRKITSAGVVSTLAGTAGVQGSADGTGPAASFYLPKGMTIDAAGNLYIGDTFNFTVRKITPAGVVTTVAGTAGVPGSADGTGPAAQFSQPQGLAVDSANNLYLTDVGNYTIRMINSAGVVTTLAGSVGKNGSADGTGAAAQFFGALGVATDGNGNIYVADGGNTEVRKIAPGAVVTTVAGSTGLGGNTDGTGPAARFDQPVGITTDSLGNVYIADVFASTIRMITPSAVVTTIAGSPVTGSPNNQNDVDGIGTAAGFEEPTGIAADLNGNLYVPDTLFDTIRKIAPGGVVTTIAGQKGNGGSTDGIGTAALFQQPGALAVDAAGNLYIADTGNFTIRKMDSSGAVTTLAGTAGVFGSADGTGAAASFHDPVDLAVDSAGNLYVADSKNFTVRKITPGGIVTTLAGTAGQPGYVDGIGAAAQFGELDAIAVDAAGNVYVIDHQQDWYVTYTGNQLIRKITPSGVVSTIVGVIGLQGFAPGPLPSALRFPRRLTVSGTSLLFTMDNGIVIVRNVP